MKIHVKGDIDYCLFIRKHCKDQIYKYSRLMEEYCEGDRELFNFYAGRLFSYREVLEVLE